MSNHSCRSKQSSICLGSLRSLFQHVHGPQERWRSETRHQSQIPEQICEIRAFQDGGPAHSQSSSPEE